MSIHDQGGIGLTAWTQILDTWLIEVAKKIGLISGITREANETGNG